MAKEVVKDLITRGPSDAIGTAISYIPTLVKRPHFKKVAQALAWAKNLASVGGPLLSAGMHIASGFLAPRDTLSDRVLSTNYEFHL